MTQPALNPKSPPNAGKRKRGNPVLATLKETGVLPEGYYRDAKGQIRKMADPPPERVPDVAFDRLKAMKHVLGNPASTDETPGEKACRAWLEKSPGPFMEALDKLEAAGRSIPEETGGGEPIEETETDDEMKAAITALIQKHAGKVKS